MADAYPQRIAKNIIDELDELVRLGKLQTHQTVDIRTHLDPLVRPAPPPVTARKPPAVPKAPSLKQCKALWTYAGAEADELSFQENDRIEIIEEVDPAWWKGCVVRPDASRSQPGLFPSNYVEEVQPASSTFTSPSLPARNMPPVYTPPITAEQSSTYYDDKHMEGYHGPAMAMPSPYGAENQSKLGPPKWKPGVARWSSGGPPAMPPPPPSHHNIYPSPPPSSVGHPSPAASNQSYYQQNAAQGPSNPALYGTQQPVVQTEEDKKKNDKLKKFGGKMGMTMAQGFSGGVGFGIGSHLFN